MNPSSMFVKLASTAFWLTPVAFYFLFPGHLLLGSQILVMALFALSLDLLLGYAGVISLGHAAFFGIGAYTAGLLAVHGWGEPISGLLAAALVAALAGLPVSFMVLRGGNLARLLITIAIATLLFEASNQATSITGGADGLQGMETWKLLGLFSFDMSGSTGYWYCFTTLLMCFLFLQRLAASPFGLSLRSIRENEHRAAAVGVPVRQRQIIAFVVSGAIAGLAGALLAQTTHFVGLEVLSLHRSSDGLLVLVLGGVGQLYGALVGASAFMLTQDALASLNPVYWEFWLGLLLVLVALFARNGILGAIDLSGRLAKRGRR